MARREHSNAEILARVPLAKRKAMLHPVEVPSGFGAPRGPRFVRIYGTLRPKELEKRLVSPMEAARSFPVVLDRTSRSSAAWTRGMRKISAAMKGKKGRNWISAAADKLALRPSRPAIVVYGYSFPHAKRELKEDPSLQRLLVPVETWHLDGLVKGLREKYGDAHDLHILTRDVTHVFKPDGGHAWKAGGLIGLFGKLTPSLALGAPRPAPRTDVRAPS